MQRKVKEIYGKEAEIKNETFLINPAGAYSCYYENGKYKYEFGGNGPACFPFTYITRVDKDGDNIYIYDKFLLVRECEEINNLCGDEYYVYNTTVSEPIDKIVDRMLAPYRVEELRSLFLKTYGYDMKEYKHTFKKNNEGNYYWYSTEPV